MNEQERRRIEQGDQFDPTGYVYLLLAVIALVVGIAFAVHWAVS